MRGCVSYIGASFYPSSEAGSQVSWSDLDLVETKYSGQGPINQSLLHYSHSQASRVPLILYT